MYWKYFNLALFLECNTSGYGVTPTTFHICFTPIKIDRHSSSNVIKGRTWLNAMRITCTGLARLTAKSRGVPKLRVIVRRAGLLWSQQDFEWRWSVPLFKCLTVLEFSFILFDLCLLITFFNFIMNYVPIVTFWIFTYHKILILSIMFCFIWSYWIIYFLACLEVSWRVVS